MKIRWYTPHSRTPARDDVGAIHLVGCRCVACSYDYPNKERIIELTHFTRSSFPERSITETVLVQQEELEKATDKWAKNLARGMMRAAKK